MLKHKLSLMAMVLISSSCLTACGGNKSEDKPSRPVSTQSEKPAAIKSVKKHFKSLEETNEIVCDNRSNRSDRKLMVPKKYLAQWAIDGAPAPYRKVHYSGLKTETLSDDSIYSMQMSYFTNSGSNVREGKEEPVYVPMVQHILINETGRYQWIENPEQTLAAIKAMPSLKDGWNMKQLEKALKPVFVTREIEEKALKYEERGAFIYAFQIWQENMQETDEPAQLLGGCLTENISIPTTAPDLDYLTYDDVWQKYKDSSDPEEAKHNSALWDFQRSVKSVQFPLYVHYGSRPQYRAK